MTLMFALSAPCHSTRSVWGRSLAPNAARQDVGGLGGARGGAYLLDLVPASKNFGLRDGRNLCEASGSPEWQIPPPGLHFAVPTTWTALSQRNQMPRCYAMFQIKVRCSFSLASLQTQGSLQPTPPSLFRGIEVQAPVAPETFCQGHAGHSPDPPRVLKHA